MRVIPVLDVRRGRAVHAVRGVRSEYRPVRSRLDPGDDPLTLARAFRDRLGLRECYLADLDAIEGYAPATTLVQGLAGLGLDVWVDAGVSDPDRARPVVDAGARWAIVGLETLGRADDLRSVAEGVPRERLAFSLDLRHGRPIVSAPELVGATPIELVGLAVNAGYRTTILLDLASVGTMAGPPDGLVPELRGRFPDLTLVIGGGVRGLPDLQRAAARGCAATLVGTALHRGHVGRADIESLATL